MNRESMKEARDIKEVILGKEVTLEELAAVARFGAKVSFSDEYRERVNKCRALVDKFVAEKRRMYGITTGLGENVKRAIPEESAIRYQKNTMLTHCTTVGEPMEEEVVRAMLFMMLVNVGSGVYGARLEALEVVAAARLRRLSRRRGARRARLYGSGKGLLSGRAARRRRGAETRRHHPLHAELQRGALLRQRLHLDKRHGRARRL